MEQFCIFNNSRRLLLHIHIYYRLFGVDYFGLKPLLNTVFPYILASTHPLFQHNALNRIQPLIFCPYFLLSSFFFPVKLPLHIRDGGDPQRIQDFSYSDDILHQMRL